MLIKVKNALRISESNTNFDDEVSDIIEAAKTDLAYSGVRNIDTSNPLIIRAIILYAKANFFNNDMAEKYKLSYESLKISLSLVRDEVEE